MFAFYFCHKLQNKHSKSTMTVTMTKTMTEKIMQLKVNFKYDPKNRIMLEKLKSSDKILLKLRRYTGGSLVSIVCKI